MGYEEDRLGSYSECSVRIKTSGIHAQGGPEYPLLFIPVELRLAPITVLGGHSRCFDILCVTATLDFKPPSASAWRVADAVPRFHVEEVRRDITTWYNLEFPLDIYRIKKLERERSGRDVNLSLRLEFFICEYTRTFLPVGDQQVEIRVGEGFVRQVSQIDFTIPKSDWVEKILPQLAHFEYFLIEIPKVKSPEGSAIFQRAWELLGQAEEAFNRWDAASVFANCREIGRLLNGEITEHGVSGFLVKERWGRAYNNFYYLASLPLHKEEIASRSGQYALEEVRVARADAEYLLYVTRFLLKFASELLSEKKEG
ncbi:MAG: hypothetical protein ACPLRM_09940 [Anaerolineae bacterium]